MTAYQLESLAQCVRESAFTCRDWATGMGSVYAVSCGGWGYLTADTIADAAYWLGKDGEQSCDDDAIEAAEILAQAAIHWDALQTIL